MCIERGARPLVVRSGPLIGSGPLAALRRVRLVLELLLLFQELNHLFTQVIVLGV